MINVSTTQRRTWVPFVTVFLALVLLVLPVQELIRGFLPDWVSLALPTRMRVSFAWLAGLAVDLVTLGIPGAHALSKAVLVYLAKMLALRVRAYPLWQQGVVVMLLLGLEVALLAILDLVTAGGLGELHRWTAVIVGGLAWPLVYIVLRRSRHLANLGH
jgi:rod shape-determining protein MreD